MQNDGLSMPDYALIAMLAAVLWLGAWREYASDNRRDAKLMAAFGAAGMMASTAVWFG